MDEADRENTAFCTRQGLFQWRVMPFGLCNAPATFERLMELVLSGLNWRICLIYLDDVIVFGRNFDEYLENFKAVWQRLRLANLRLKPSKCALFREKVPFLGHVVTRTGVEVDPAKTSAVENWPEPETVKDVRAFLGLASYYRRYIPNFATLAAPLVDLIKKDCPKHIIWTTKHDKAFRELKTALAAPPVLSYPLREGFFFLSTDASDCGTGAVLEQEQWEDGKLERRVIAYASKTLSRSQRKYCATNKELLAVVTACEQFRYYLLGRHFTLITDHASLTWLVQFKDPEGMVARWISRLDVFDFDTVHRAGKKHLNADALSRQTSRPCKRQNCPECMPIRKTRDSNELVDTQLIRSVSVVENADMSLLDPSGSLYELLGDPEEDDSAIIDQELESWLETRARGP